MTDIVAEHVEGTASDCRGEAPGQVGKGTPRLGKGSLTSQTKATLEFILALSGIPEPIHAVGPGFKHQPVQEQWQVQGEAQRGERQRG